MRMKAAVMFEQGLEQPFAVSKPFHIEDVDLDGPYQGEVLVEVRAAGVCHSDLSVAEGQRKRTLPVVGGHEGAGIVREVGPGVVGLEPGDHVVMSAAGGCGQCRYCMAGRPGICDRIGVSRSQGLLPNGERRLSLNGEALFHYSGVSCFAQFAVTTPGSLIKIDKDIPLDVAAIFGCAVVTGAGAVMNAARVCPGDAVAVVGLGGVGLTSVMAAQASGASIIIGIDLLDSKFPIAKEVGCTHTFSGADPDLVAKIRDLTHGGVDFAFELTANQRALNSAFDYTRKAGEIVCVGVSRADSRLDFPNTRLVSEDKVIRGAMLGSGVAERDIPKYLNLFREGNLPVDKLHSGSITFDDLNESLDHLHDATVIRQMLDPHA
ncbi:zinc-binding dehydrogenase [Rhodococcus sp. NPDC057014]|uniref:zinc-binding dehydrogenase n=1 Tax=Rhodococcus sp. NPDC057014 TaxID=3346000 RepID=UPI0036325E01